MGSDEVGTQRDTSERSDAHGPSPDDAAPASAPEDAPQALRESEARYRFLAESMPHVVWTMTPVGLIDYTNRSLAAYIGRRIESATDADWTDFVHPDDIRVAIDRWRRARASGDPYEFESRIRRHDGAYRWFLTRVVPMREAAGRITKWFGTSTDIDELKRTEASQRFLAEVATILGSSLDYRQTLRNVARMAVPHLGDFCIFDLVEDGHVVRVEVSHAAPSDAETAHSVQRYSIDAAPAHPAVQAIRTGASIYWPEVSPANVEAIATSDDHLQLLRSMGLRSLISVPLVARGATLGALTVIVTRPGRHYAPRDVRETEELAQRAAVAIDHARLYAEAERARALASRERERLESIFMAAPLAIAVRRGPDHVFEFVNALFQKRVGDRQLLGKPYVEALPELAAHKPMFDHVYTTGEMIRRPTAVVRFDGNSDGRQEEYFFDVIVAPVRDPDGTISGTINLSFDVTEQVIARRKAEALAEARQRLLQENTRLYEDAREASRVKDEFLAVVSHELRTPLSAIVGWASILGSERGKQASTLERGVDVIRRNAAALNRLVEDLLDVSRAINGKLKIEPQPTSMTALVRDAIEAVRPAAAAKTITLSCDTDGDALPLVGDPARLGQVVWNLLSNAIKFTPPRGTVSVSLAQAGPSVVLKITDDGRGISADFLPFVFDRFRQADSSTTRGHGGLGLGLAIVRHIVELHGGSVVAESPGEGLGSTFTVTLPSSGPSTSVSGGASPSLWT